ncbi:MAG: hypothetical protein AAFU85_33590, partial [Planctomycetota bacterium]
ISNAQESHSHGSEQKTIEKSLVITPLVTLKPGETKELLFSTSCTVGATRGGGFSLAEMRDGRPQFKASKLKGNRVFTDRGVTITVPDFQTGPKFANSDEFALLKEHKLNAFKITIEASDEASPRVLDMHVLDATCSGQCKTDFRVLVVAP